jgi:carnitine O-palmitoyltransferase 2
VQVHAAAAELPVVTEPAKAVGLPPLELKWDLDDAMRAEVAGAKAVFDGTIARTELDAYRTPEINSKVLKAAKLSPDGVMQMSFQLAHSLMHGGPLPSTYESASTAAFKHGRTETIRSATPEAAAFVAAFTDPSTSLAERAGALRQAVDNHSRITREALMGQGMDRHMFALEHVAGLQGRSHALFESAAMAKLKRIILSTSTLNSEALSNGGFGPVNDDCYAIGYGIRSFGAEARVMSYGRDSAGFAACIGEAMRLILEAARAPTE